MFDRISEAAEKLATNVSRRGFLGSVGRWSGATALAMAGVLTSAGTTRADSGRNTCCSYGYPAPVEGYQICHRVCVPLGTACPPASAAFGYCPTWATFIGSVTVHKCANCS